LIHKPKIQNTKSFKLDLERMRRERGRGKERRIIDKDVSIKKEVDDKEEENQKERKWEKKKKRKQEERKKNILK
jgi:hypothetical protein